jgi:hypothetical protein
MSGAKGKAKPSFGRLHEMTADMAVDLDESLEGASEDLDRGDIAKLPTEDISRIHPDPEQPRRFFDVQGLAEAIKTRGRLLRPLVLRPRRERDGGWFLEDGERRWRALGLIAREAAEALKAGDRATYERLAPLSRVPYLLHNDTGRGAGRGTFDLDRFIDQHVEDKAKEKKKPIEDVRAVGRIWEGLRVAEGRELSAPEMAQRLADGEKTVQRQMRIARALTAEEIGLIIEGHTDVGLDPLEALVAWLAEQEDGTGLSEKNRQGAIRAFIKEKPTKGRLPSVLRAFAARKGNRGRPARVKVERSVDRQKGVFLNYRIPGALMDVATLKRARKQLEEDIRRIETLIVEVSN